MIPSVSLMVANQHLSELREQGERHRLARAAKAERRNRFVAAKLRVVGRHPHSVRGLSSWVLRG